MKIKVKLKKKSKEMNPVLKMYDIFDLNEVIFFS